MGPKLIICQSPTLEKLFFCLNPRTCSFTNWSFWCNILYFLHTNFIRVHNKPLWEKQGWCGILPLVQASVFFPGTREVDKTNTAGRAARHVVMRLWAALSKQLRLSLNGKAWRWENEGQEEQRARWGQERQCQFQCVCVCVLHGCVVCVYICICVCMCIVSACMCDMWLCCVCVCMHLYVYVCVSVCIVICMCVCMCDYQRINWF